LASETEIPSTVNDASDGRREIAVTVACCRIDAARKSSTEIPIQFKMWTNEHF